MLNRLEYINLANNNYKFWEAELGEDDSSTTLIVRWGRIGTRGQSKTYEFVSHSAALWNYYEKIAEKQRKGYQTTTTVSATPSVSQEISVEKKEEKTVPVTKQGHRSLSQYMSK